jgi:predicted nucleic acid-binding protein
VSPVYVDSSALVKLLVREAESDALRRYLSSAGPLTSSILATVEVARAVARSAPDSSAAVAAVFETLSVLAFDARIAARAAALSPAGLRALEAIHLATALELADELAAFVSYDDRLSAAARDLGMPVVSPASDA